ncbi:hypothetical protein ACF3NS_01795 [Arsenicicoccus cauae]|nr:hypothetical protein [Arsenicicoccus cauae]
MATGSKIAHDQQRREVVARHAEERRALERVIADPTADAMSKGEK